MVRKMQLSQYQNATRDFAVSFIREPVEALTPHVHDYYQLYYVTEGELRHHLDGGFRDLHPGDGFLLPPNVPHYIEKKTESAAFYAVSFQKSFLSGHLPMVDDFLLSLPQLKKLPSQMTLPEGDRALLQNVLSKMTEECACVQAGSWEILRQGLLLVLTLFARCFYETVLAEDPVLNNRQKVLHVIDFLNVHFTREITLEQVVAENGISKASFCKLFESLTGMTFSKYLHTRRIEKAKQLIYEGYKIAQVSDLCGYQDFSTFYRNFKKITGISPTDYRAEEMSHSR